MLKIRTAVQKSTIPDAGLGLITLDNLIEGQIVEEIDTELYARFSVETVSKMWELQRDFFKCYSFIQEGYHYLPLDNARFMNHSESPNLSYRDKKWIANRRIAAGEELFTDYKEFAEEGVDW